MDQSKRKEIVNVNPRWKNISCPFCHEYSKNIYHTFSLKLYNRVHQAVDQPQVSLGKEPDFKDYYKPSSSQKTGEIAYVAGGMVAVVYLASKFI